jgi:hypothetical protein
VTDVMERLTSVTHLSKVDIAEIMLEVYRETCQLWPGRVDAAGYGRGKGSHTAHRLAYIAAYGPVPKGLEIDHLCRNRRCVNVDHLEAVTHAENMRRARRAHLRDACVNGHQYTLKTTYIRANGTRECRTCNAASVARYAAKRRSN